MVLRRRIERLEGIFLLQAKQLNIVLVDSPKPGMYRVLGSNGKKYGSKVVFSGTEAEVSTWVDNCLPTPFVIQLNGPVNPEVYGPVVGE